MSGRAAVPHVRRNAARVGVRVIAGSLAAVASLAASNLSVASGGPQVGRHDAEFCVTTSPTPAPPGCGPVQVDVGDDGALRVRIDDIVYYMQLREGKVAVVLMHGAMQIDAFSASYAWIGDALRFDDDERHARYQLRFPAKPKEP